jgi:3',5'-cyclic-AMP phosphodiesterase
VGVEVDADAAARPGAAWITGLEPGTAYDLTVEHDRGSTSAGSFSTLDSPPGTELFRFATVNDVHIGEPGWGVRHRLTDPSGHPVPYPRRCLDAALSEAAEWGASRIVAKGDLSHRGARSELEEVAAALTAPGLPVHAVLGNHDVLPGAADGVAVLRAAGIDAPREPSATDLPGLRLVLGHTAVPGKGSGRVEADQRRRLAELVAGPLPAFVALHHYPQRWRVPNLWPPGIPGPQASALLSALAEANPATLVASGHSHRHRRHQHQKVLTHVEIGSTKDYPGAWAGYVVHEGGIRQVVARVAHPDAIAWTEHSRRAMAGVWGWWSPGLRSHRCFSLDWPSQSPSA